ncbi:hypothetical protein [Paraburkholderia podalyriae]|uniref:hypothetical protein n=1 Tax=Paraburkholderia podalyriae TaxID=1938811 RepID=UPI00165662FE|nr:hypothetical protein [Paraburkholderia podalyriae]
MRAPDDAIDGDDRTRTMLFNEPDDCFGDFRIGSRIGRFTEPPLNRISIRAFVRDDADGNLRRPRVIGPIAGHRCDRLAAETLAAFFREPVPVPLRFQCHVASVPPRD